MLGPSWHLTPTRHSCNPTLPPAWPVVSIHQGAACFDPSWVKEALWHPLRPHDPPGNDPRLVSQSRLGSSVDLLANVISRGPRPEARSAPCLCFILALPDHDHVVPTHWHGAVHGMQRGLMRWTARAVPTCDSQEAVDSRPGEMQDISWSFGHIATFRVVRMVQNFQLLIVRGRRCTQGIRQRTGEIYKCTESIEARLGECSARGAWAETHYLVPGPLGTYPPGT